MAKMHRFKVAITQITNNGAYVYGGCDEYRGEAEFTYTYGHCHFNGKTLNKIEGHLKGGNYSSMDDGEIYSVMKFEKLKYKKQQAISTLKCNSHATSRCIKGQPGTADRL